MGCGGGGIACDYLFGYFVTDENAEAQYYSQNRDTTLTVQYNLFYNNSVIAYGGAVQVSGTTIPNFNNNTVVNNRCTARKTAAELPLLRGYVRLYDKIQISLWSGKSVTWKLQRLLSKPL